jgi:uncharacterized RDD family membrane protein YckC
VIQTCTHCGAVHEERTARCCLCDAQLAPEQTAPVAVGRPAPTDGNLAVDLDWRREVAHRLAVYRARRHRPLPNDSQVSLPFHGESPEPAEDHVFFLSGERPADSFGLPQGVEQEPAEAEHASRVERVEITVTQPYLDFPNAADQPAERPKQTVAVSTSPPVPVAPLDERRRAGLFDAAFLVLAYAGFLALFKALGGHFSFGKPDALVYAATLLLFCAQYLALFTVFGGATPGMLLRGLRVVSFDGSAPTRRQLVWRSFGYLVSGGTAFIGFLWAVWDEDNLTWHDRISQTYLTAAPRVGERESLGVRDDAQTHFRQ